jgi:hypothetical protein
MEARAPTNDTRIARRRARHDGRVTQLPERIRRRLARDFPDAAEVVIAASAVARAASCERTQAAIVLWAGGDLGRLRDAADMALIDWRDVLVRAGLADDDWPERIEAEFGTSDEWESSDAWFATALAWCGSRRPDLTDVIAAGDVINHSILSRAEIQQAVRRLLGAGLLDVSEDRFVLTRAGRALVRKRTGQAVEQMRSVQALLASQPLVETPWSISAADVDSAYERYRGRF